MAKKKQASGITIDFQQDGHVTKNTFRFEEVDSDNNVLEMRDAIIGKIYMKKKAFGENVETPPDTISISVDW